MSNYRIRRKLLSVYLRVLRFFCGCPAEGVLTLGKHCSVADPTIETTRGDVVHPCVRYEKEGIMGHQWWMVYTPYFQGNAALENPRLCFADVPDGCAPTEWCFDRIIQDRPTEGYYSDPTLLVTHRDDGLQMYVFWRENYSERTRHFGCKRATVGCRVLDETIEMLPSPLLADYYKHKDKEVCPTIVEWGGGYRSYSMDFHFCSKVQYYLPRKLKNGWTRAASVCDTLHLNVVKKSKGIAIWNSLSLDRSFEYEKTVRFVGMNRFYKPWHMDFFEVDGVWFSVVQTNQKRPDICLARSDDGERFRFFKKPLITQRTVGKVGIYKPSAVVVDGIFYLFYTAQDADHPGLNKLYVTTETWTVLLDKLSGKE